MRRRVAVGAALVAGVMLATPAWTSPVAGQAVGVDDFAWMAGEWEGAGPGDALAEIDYMPPEGGVLPAVFRLLQDDRLLVLELITLVEDEEGLTMYVRHFDPALAPLEEEAAIALRLVGREGDTFHFENVNEGQNPVRATMTRTADGFVSRSELARPDGSTDEIRVEYRRRDGAAGRP